MSRPTALTPLTTVYITLALCNYFSQSHKLLSIFQTHIKSKARLTTTFTTTTFPTLYRKTDIMPRGAGFDQSTQLSDNPIEQGPDQVHGTDPSQDNANLNRAHKAAPMPDATGNSEPYVGQGAYKNPEGSGKGGHEPNSLGEKKGEGAQPGN